MSKIKEYEDAAYLFRLESRRFLADLERVFFQGSEWWCWHGSTCGYAVRVLGVMLLDLDGTVKVENIATGKKKWVKPSALHRILIINGERYHDV